MYPNINKFFWLIKICNMMKIEKMNDMSISVCR